MDNTTLSTQKVFNKNILKFLLPSFLGLILFVIPLPYGNMIALEGLSSYNIGIGFLAELIKTLFANYLPYFAMTIIVISAVLSVVSNFINIKNDFLRDLLKVSPLWLIFRVLGAIFVTMSVLNMGPEFIISADTGQTMLSLLPSLVAIFFVSGFLLPLVVDFGLMDFLGTLISKSMYKLFQVPGRAAIDAVSSWLGDGTLGIMITDTQYKQGYYTAKESAIISVCFSLVSLPFSTVIANELGFMPIFPYFYGSVCVASLACALIMPRIFPLNKFKNETYNNVTHLKEEAIPTDCKLFNVALERALKRADCAPSLTTIVNNGFKTVIDMYFALLPLVMAWGTLSLIVAEFTPFFNIISIPVVWILNLLQIPDAVQAAPAVLVGFTDMFLPSIMISGGDVNEMTKFIIGALSISQLVYLTETGAVILKSDIPIKFKDLFLIFLTRTIITLPIITLIANIIF